MDQALGFGWIDGIGRSLDGERSAIRFTPRRRVAELGRLGLLHPAGLTAYEARRPDRLGVYS